MFLTLVYCIDPLYFIRSFSHACLETQLHTNTINLTLLKCKRALYRYTLSKFQSSVGRYVTPFNILSISIILSAIFFFSLSIVLLFPWQRLVTTLTSNLWHTNHSFGKVSSANKLNICLASQSDFELFKQVLVY